MNQRVLATAGAADMRRPPSADAATEGCQPWPALVRPPGRPERACCRAAHLITAQIRNLRGWYTPAPA